MKTLFYIIQKEFLQIRRNRLILPVLFMMPFVQLIILGYAASFEIKNLNVYIIDHDNSSLSRGLISKFSSSKYFKIVNSSYRYDEGMKELKTGEADIVLEIPNNLERKLVIGDKAAVKLNIDAVNGVKGVLANAYSNMIIEKYNQEKYQELTGRKAHAPIALEWSNWYNPDLNYSTFMVPGILVMIVTMIGLFLTSINIVREKEIGTIEQLNVTPIKKRHFIIGKLTPFFIIALIELSLGLLVARIVFNIHFQGNILLIYLFMMFYLPAILGIGLFISTVTKTQQQSMFISWFFLMIFVLMSGLFTPIENMPGWAQKITLFNPVRYFIEMMRMVLLKGSGFKDVTPYFLIMLLFAFFFNSFAILNYRKTNE